MVIAVAYACLQNSPTWMNDIRQEIENLSLSELFIPGTHDSASYILSTSGYSENILQRYIYTQVSYFLFVIHST